MATKISFDTSELRTLAADMRAVPDRLQRHVVPVVERGANNIKREVASNFEASTHFSAIARTVRYDLRQTSFGGIGVVEAEIGPLRDRDGGQAGAEALAHIAVYGSPRGGGGSVKDPQAALDSEAPRFEEALGSLLEELL